jgi:hypothetical protein
MVLDSDSPAFDGFGRIDNSTEYFTVEQSGQPQLKVYLPARASFVLKFVD